MTEDFCVAGIDAGGTKTECAIVNSRGECLGIGYGGPSNAHYVTWETARESLEAAARSADEAAGRDHPPVVVVGSFSFPARRLKQDEEVQEQIEALDSIFRQVFGDAVQIQYHLEGQVALACIDVFEPPGVACIAGTGSSGFAFGPDGRYVLIGGWGSPLGDEGGGIDIAIRGLKAVGRASEGRGPSTMLESLAAEFFGQPVDGLFLALLGKRISAERTRIASFARMVSAAAEDGDEVAREILDYAARELAGLILGASKKLFTHDTEFPVALHGSVFLNESIQHCVTEAVHEQFPFARVVRSIHTPGVGAALLTLHDLRKSQQ